MVVFCIFAVMNQLLEAFFVGLRLGLPANHTDHAHIRMFYKGIKGLEGEYFEAEKVQQWDTQIKAAYQASKKVLLEPIGILEKLVALDKVITEHTVLTEVGEYLVDILLVYFFTEENKTLDETYFESAAWLAIEDKLAERGTELLNVMLYINEANQSEQEISLEGYIEDFLLIGDEINEDQENLKLYEPLIDSEQYLEYPPLDIYSLYERLPETLELKELYFPLMCFFRSPQTVESTLLSAINCGGNASLHGALLAALLVETNGWQRFPKSYQTYLES